MRRSLFPALGLPSAPGPRGERRGGARPGSATATAGHERGSQGLSSRGAGSDIARPSGPGRSPDCGAGADSCAGPLPHCQPGSRRPACDIYRREGPRPPHQSPPRIASSLPALGFHAAPAAGLRSSPPLRGGARSPRSPLRVGSVPPPQALRRPRPSRPRPRPHPAKPGFYWLLFPPLTLWPVPRHRPKTVEGGTAPVPVGLGARTLPRILVALTPAKAFSQSSIAVAVPAVLPALRRWI